MRLKKAAILFLCMYVLINSGCSKSNATNNTTNNNTSTDPAVLILGKWQVIKDSIVVNNFAFSDGTIPIPGVYYGTPNDYWLFQSTGNLYIYEGGPVGNTPYQVSGNNLLITGAQWGNVTILTLTNNSFIWEKAMTSSNGGTYYRKFYSAR